MGNSEYSENPMQLCEGCMIAVISPLAAGFCWWETPLDTPGRLAISPLRPGPGDFAASAGPACDFAICAGPACDSPFARARVAISPLAPGRLAILPFAPRRPGDFA
jgi:hypothetical protein